MVVYSVVCWYGIEDTDIVLGDTDKHLAFTLITQRRELKSQAEKKKLHSFLKSKDKVTLRRKNNRFISRRTQLSVSIAELRNLLLQLTTITIMMNCQRFEDLLVDLVTSVVTAGNRTCGVMLQ